MNISAPLVDADGNATQALQGVLRDVPNAPIVDANGLPTVVFRQYLAPKVKQLPNASVPLTNPDGTPTRAMTRLLMSLK